MLDNGTSFSSSFSLPSRVFLFPVISRTSSAVKSTTNAEIYAAGLALEGRKSAREGRDPINRPVIPFDPF